MKERMRRIVCCVGTVGVMTIMMTVPAMAAEVTEDKDINIEASADIEDSAQAQEAEETEASGEQAEEETAD